MPETRTHEEAEELIARLRAAYNARGAETFSVIVEGFAWRSKPPTRYVTAAAIRVRDVVYQLPPPARHPDVMRVIPRELRDVKSDDGFVDNGGKFVSREEALAIAREAGQIVRRCGGDERWLSSEGLW